MSASFRSRAASAVVLAVFVAASCRGTGVPRSDWPSPDFYLEVRGRTQTGGDLIERQSLHVFADGFTVYREADPNDAFAEQWPPVLSRVSAYRMLPESTRSLARSLYLIGLFQIDTVVGTDVDAEDVVALRWRAFGEERRTVARGRVYGPVVSAINVINAYLPAGCAFALPDMTGEPEPPRLTRVPQPERSVAGALELHREWAARWDDPDVQWRIEMFALAARAGDLGTARDQLDAIERVRQEYQTRFPDDRSVSEEVVARLRRLLPPAGGSAPATSSGR
ncbi:MAG: hypothetical protein R3F56_00155 [Planctomycetota bacterium]